MNTLTTVDVQQTAVQPKAAYNYFAPEWATSGDGVEPVSTYGLQGLGLGNVMDTLNTKVLGIPLWGIGAAAAAFFFLGGQKMLKRMF